MSKTFMKNHNVSNDYMELLNTLMDPFKWLKRIYKDDYYDVDDVYCHIEDEIMPDFENALRQLLNERYDYENQEYYDDEFYYSWIEDIFFDEEDDTLVFDEDTKFNNNYREVLHGVLEDFAKEINYYAYGLFHECVESMF